MPNREEISTFMSRLVEETCQRNNWTRTELAERLGVSSESVWRWCQGDVAPSAQALIFMIQGSQPRFDLTFDSSASLASAL